jgi:hypothetical protein
MSSFFKSLLDLKFEHFVTRKIAGVFYAITLGVIAIGTLAVFIQGLWQGFIYGSVNLMVIVSPLAGFIAVVLTRLVFEASIALVAIAENTKK